MGYWQPLLPRALAHRALDLAQEIARDLEARQAEPASSSLERGSLTSGVAGRILFLTYLDRAFPEGGWGDRAAEAIEQAIADLAEMPADLSLYTGISGVAWVLEHLQGWFLDDEDEDPGEDVAASIKKSLGIPWRHFDLLQGLCGVGVWALERLPRAEAEECLRRIVAALTEMADRRNGTASWRHPADLIPEERRSRCPQGLAFTGVAHGVAGVIALLSEVEASEVECRPLLDQAVHWLLAQKLPPDAASVFPYEVADVVTPGVLYPMPTRLAWCHGDPGIAAALLGAARRVGEPAWECEAVELARAAAARSTSEKSIVDGSLCHGSAGLLHLFNRLYQATGDPALAEAARFWFDRTLELRRPGEGVAGFLSWDQDAQGKLGWRTSPGFLTGASGIGLALLAAATPIEPAWDRALLISIP